jgi:hypothetical protein
MKQSGRRENGLTARGRPQVYFIAEIVAYDISMICETAHQHHCPGPLAAFKRP